MGQVIVRPSALALAFTLALAPLPAVAAPAAEPNPYGEPVRPRPEENPYGEPVRPAPEVDPYGVPLHDGVRVTLPPKPTKKGEALLIAAGAATVVSWALRFASIGVGLPLVKGCDLNDDACEKRVRTVQALSYTAPAMQGVASALVIPAALFRGRAEAWRFLSTGVPNRPSRQFAVAGAVLFGIFTAASIAARPAFVFGCIASDASVRRCNTKGTFAGYNVAVQVSDTLSTTGLGLLTFGTAYGRYRQRYGLAAAPFSHRGAHGVSISGRF